MAHPPALGPLSTQPVFNTKAVARETGVPADTFRAWERRYGVPLPQRTDGGHRLYSERDIATIRWLRDRTADGMNISQAVQLLKSAAEPKGGAVEVEVNAIERLYKELVLALTTFDAAGADVSLGKAFGFYPFEEVMIGAIQPAMVEIGERWHRGEINVATEHFASEFVRRKLAGLLNIFLDGTQHATIVVGCAPGELHELGALMIALVLARRGWNVMYLGAQVPLADLVAAVRILKPALVCLSASTIEATMRLGETGHALLSAAPDVRFGYGGRAFNLHPELRATMPGTFLGQDARELADTLVDMFRRSPASATEERM